MVWVKLFEEEVNPFPEGYWAGLADVEAKTRGVPSDPVSYIRDHIFDLYNQALEQAKKKYPQYRDIYDRSVLHKVIVYGRYSPDSFHYYVRFILALPPERGGASLQWRTILLTALQYLFRILVALLIASIVIFAVLMLLKVSPDLQNLLRDLSRYVAYTAIASAVAIACLVALPKAIDVLSRRGRP